MKEKYYTPNLEEFHVGFEYEYLTNDVRQEEHFHKDVFNGIDTFEDKECLHLIDIKNIIEKVPDDIRVKYLDTEDIKECGGTNYQEGYEYDHTWDIGKHHELKAWFHRGLPIVRITRKDFSNVFLFHGDIKNKSELKKLIQQLNIM